MADGIIGALLAQSRPSSTVAATAFTALQATEITRVVVANTTGGAATFRLFHDDDGTTFDQTTALYYDVSVATGAVNDIQANNQGTGIFVAKGGSIGVRSDTASALTFSLYGRAREGR